VLGIAAEYVISVQLIRFSPDSPNRLQSEDELRFRLYPSAVDLVGRRSAGAKPADLLQNHALELPQRMAGRRRGGQLQISANLSRILRRRHVGCDAFLEDETPIEP